MSTVRAEAAADVPAVHQVNELAFGRPGEADLVDALRAAARPYISLVAVDEGQVSRQGLVKYHPEFGRV